ncbi:DNA-binding transcriptional regulator, AcrR family [Lentzea waywayandensis]|uniref:DNA-binding transcriptional regulator, AcrR family n=1 Tax=Lentzea waywayandensis TaxID=84724 RepID=A0A1I6DN17_9PSEU|nr:TetR/AcrR family transcriptional regulator [Lentzea waywayandensis]SFR06762.1 DNA-binding transcriptional regulator, AcrR family [Lentzea waywayandensis]
MNTTRRKYARRLPPEQRREQLLDAALSLIPAGFDTVTMESVAKEAQVTKPVLYDLFANRSELISALLDREAGRATEQVIAALPTDFATRSPDDAFADAVRVFVNAVMEAPDRWRLVLLPPEGTPHEFRAQVELVRAGVLAQIEDLAALGLKELGRLDDLDSALLGHAMLALAEMSGRLVLTDPEKFTPDRLAAFVTRIAHGLR